MLRSVLAPPMARRLAAVEVAALRSTRATSKPGTVFVAVPGVEIDGHDYAEAAVGQWRVGCHCRAGAAAARRAAAAGRLVAFGAGAGRRVAERPSRATSWASSASPARTARRRPRIWFARCSPSAGMPTGMITHDRVDRRRREPRRLGQHDARGPRSSTTCGAWSTRATIGRGRVDLARTGPGARCRGRLRRRGADQHHARAPRPARDVGGLRRRQALAVRATRGAADNPDKGWPKIGGGERGGRARRRVRPGRAPCRRRGADVRGRAGRKGRHHRGGLRDDGDGLRLRVRTPRWADDWPCSSSATSTPTTRWPRVGVGEALGLDPDAMRRGVESLESVAGRMIRSTKGSSSASTWTSPTRPARWPRHLTRSLRIAAARGGGLISLFGSPGARDIAKRPMMGRAAGERSRVVVLADDDPRNEDRMGDPRADRGRRGGGRTAARSGPVPDPRSRATRSAERSRWHDPPTSCCSRGRATSRRSRVPKARCRGTRPRSLVPRLPISASRSARRWQREFRRCWGSRSSSARPAPARCPPTSTNPPPSTPSSTAAATDSPVVTLDPSPTPPGSPAASRDGILETVDDRY